MVFPNNNLGSHSTYDANVNAKLDAFYLEYTQSGATQITYNILKNKVFSLIMQIKLLLVNPSTHPNSLIF